MQPFRSDLMNTNNPVLFKALAVVLGTTVISNAFGDEYHYRDILIGDRAAGLGGAYTAIADDASGLYYNPAGVVYTPTSKISGSANAFQMKTTTYQGITKANPNQKWTRTSSGMVANFFGMVQPLGKGTIGFSIAIPNYELEDQSDSASNISPSSRAINTGFVFENGGAETFKADQNGIKSQVTDYNNQDSTTLAGVSYAYPISSSLSLGATLYGYIRKKELTFYQANLIEGEFDSAPGAKETIKDTLYQKVQTNEFGLQPRFGLMWTPAEKFSIGAMIQTTLILSQDPETRYINTVSSKYGESSFNSNTTQFDTANTSFADDEIGLKGLTDNDLPVELNIGAAYFASDALLYSADFSYASETDVYESTWNAAAGVEYFLDAAWALRGGVYTNHANTDENVGNSGDPHIDLYGIAFSASKYTKGSNITVGLNYASGSGDANLFQSSSNTQAIDVQSINLFVSTSASF